jgi:hypothetical protein
MVRSTLTGRGDALAAAAHSDEGSGKANAIARQRGGESDRCRPAACSKSFGCAVTRRRRAITSSPRGGAQRRTRPGFVADDRQQRGQHGAADDLSPKSWVMPWKMCRPARRHD